MQKDESSSSSVLDAARSPIKQNEPSTTRYRPEGVTDSSASKVSPRASRASTTDKRKAAKQKNDNDVTETSLKRNSLGGSQQPDRSGSGAGRSRAKAETKFSPSKDFPPSPSMSSVEDSQDTTQSASTSQQIVHNSIAPAAEAQIKKKRLAKKKRRRRPRSRRKIVPRPEPGAPKKKRRRSDGSKQPVSMGAPHPRLLEHILGTTAHDCTTNEV